MSRQHDSGAALIALERVIDRWDYDTSVKKMRPLVKQWRRATEEVLRELYLAREYISRQKGQHKDPEADNYIIYTWSGYCGEIGMSYQTANNWLRPFTPKELSDTGKDTLLLMPPINTESTADRAIMEARIEKVLRTGKRPTNWTDKEEAELKRRMASARIAKLVEDLKMPAEAKTKRDYFADIMKRSKDIVNFQLADRNQLLAQAIIFDHIDTYLKTFDDPEIKAQAAFNLALRTRNISNEIAEMNVQFSESMPPKDSEHDS